MQSIETRERVVVREKVAERFLHGLERQETALSRAKDTTQCMGHERNIAHLRGPDQLQRHFCNCLDRTYDEVAATRERH